MKMKMPIHINSDAGSEIYEFLKSKLSLPENCVEVILTLKQNDLFTVSCKYYPSKEEHVYKNYDLFTE